MSHHSPGEDSPRWLVGIDLGTSHTVVAASQLETSKSETIEGFEIEQLIGAGRVAPRSLLPSVRYQASADEIDSAGSVLPWSQGHDGVLIVGELARQMGAKTPGRLITSAKSWLSHPTADRTAPILPWGAADEVTKISPVEASASYLRHVRAAWNHRHPESPLENQDVTITVPASFDEAAREFTSEAARDAGIKHFHLLEEPQAVFYDWLWREGPKAKEKLSDVKLVLVVDLGGGTLDLTLIAVKDAHQGTVFTRIAVGQHLMLGGDNLDLALAHLAEKKLEAEGGRISPSEFSFLVEQCRQAKEVLLSDSAPESVKVTLLGGGGRLIGGAKSVLFEREEVQTMLLEGFFPLLAEGEMPDRRRSGVVEYGLPFVKDPAVTRHISSFLHEHRHVAAEALGGKGSESLLPDALLLNGGVFKSRLIENRIREQFLRWGAVHLCQLQNSRPEESVAHGAVASAWARRGKKIKKIGGGAARSLYLVLEGESSSQKACCLLPRGTEEGREILLDDRRFRLTVGSAVNFHLVASQDDLTPSPGELVDLTKDGFSALPPLSLLLESQGTGRDTVEVQLAASLSPIGTLDLECIATDDRSKRWKIEFQLRNRKGSAPLPGQNQSGRNPLLGAAREQIMAIFGPPSKSIDAKAVKRLRADLERLLGGRETWGLGLLRDLADILLEGAANRRRSPEHERVWLNLLGFCLRPGFGHPSDKGRLDKVLKTLAQSPQFIQESQVWSEWWTFWRRVSGGLDGQHQSSLLDLAIPYLEPSRLRRPQQAELARKRAPDDLLRMAASMEHLSAKDKTRLGQWILPRLDKHGDARVHWWALGRLGARKLWHGSAHTVIPPDDVKPWLERMLAEDFRKNADAALSVALIARLVGDRVLDIPEEMRSKVIKALTDAKQPESWIHLVNELSTLNQADEQRVVGEALPPGLELIE